MGWRTVAKWTRLASLLMAFGAGSGFVHPWVRVEAQSNETSPMARQADAPRRAWLAKEVHVQGRLRDALVASKTGPTNLSSTREQSQIVALWTGHGRVAQLSPHHAAVPSQLAVERKLDQLGPMATPLPALATRAPTTRAVLPMPDQAGNVDLVWSRSDFARVVAAICLGWALVVLVVARKMWTMQRANARLTDLAHRDELTGLANRRAFLEVMERAMVAGSPGSDRRALLFIDLDGFKAVNDSFGHAVGDRMLIAVSDRLRSVVGPSDVLARLGGDEFALLVSDLVPEVETRDFVKRIREAVSGASIEGSAVRLSASVGLARLSDHPHAGASLLDLADERMYLDKQHSKSLALHRRPERTADVRWLPRSVRHG
ncbi:GGDEF domain-containing protein [Rubellimicrobium rubrum]|uniref:GGDEF domain-containing protein n=1 Tax=Rubellimicrobium rubrum TaxID=2585369 RepID=A0A5C4ML72_9RHOB|nr:GGDEF domain-containing protein [Rubellimicrobium rubrum]TNC44870.1 GGDEF domain-containing protein [Rubellimicrobium rubrum]